MPIKATAVVRKETLRNPNTRNTDIHAVLILLDEHGQEYVGSPRRLASFEEVGNLLQREAGIPYEALQDRVQRYERGEDVRLNLNLDNEDAIRHLGFTPKSQDSAD